MTEDELTCPNCNALLQFSEMGSLYICGQCQKGFFVTVTPIDNRRLRVSKRGDLIELREVTLSPLLRNQILKSRTGSADTEFHEVGDVGDVEEGSFKWVRCGEEGIILARLDGKLYAMTDTCTHAMGPLMLGRMEGGELVCPEHGARFDVCTGAPVNWPNIPSLQTYEVKIEGSKVLVRKRS